jgi:AcrR family transcriptional regulator
MSASNHLLSAPGFGEDRQMDVRAALLQAAVTVFAEVGSRGATTRRIARQAGVNEVTLFRHFATKEDLLRAAFDHVAQQAVTMALPDDPVDPEAELLAWCRAHHRELYRLRALIRKFMGEYEERPQHCMQGMEVSVRIARHLTDYLRQLKRKGLAAGDWDERAACAMLMGTIFSDAMGRDTMPERYPYSMRAAVEKYVRLFLNAIGVPPGAAARPTRSSHVRT